MKKILIDRNISKELLQKKSFLNRAEMRLLTAASHDEALKIHRAEHVDIIITDRDTPGISGDQLCALIKKDPDLHSAAIIIVCACDTAQMARSIRAGADAVILRPIKPSFLLAKVKQLLELSWRETYRVILDVSVDGKAEDGTFSYRSMDISVQGLLLETSRTFTIGERVACSFVLPDSSVIRARGEAARRLEKQPGSDGNRYGVHFLDLAGRDARPLRSFSIHLREKKSPGIY